MAWPWDRNAGWGGLITTEECLLDPKRNPGMTRAQIEAALLASYGASKVVWLPYGLAGDDITNGHVDLDAATDACGRPFQIVEMHHQPPTSTRPPATSSCRRRANRPTPLPSPGSPRSSPAARWSERRPATSPGAAGASTA